MANAPLNPTNPITDHTWVIKNRAPATIEKHFLNSNVPSEDSAAKGQISPNLKHEPTDRQTTPTLDHPIFPGIRITEVIARGGMGNVYAGVDEQLDREVVVKTLRADFDSGWFIREAKITAQLAHPAIPPVHSLGSTPTGEPYLVMKRIRGRTLTESLNSRSSPNDDFRDLLAAFEHVSQAVGFAHKRGVIHRDLKPDNIMVGEFGEVQVMDWGLAKRLNDYPRDQVIDRWLTETPADRRNQTQIGMVLGTPGFMAPEQAAGRTADARADVFSLGSILTALLTGQPAVCAQTPHQAVEKTAKGDLAEGLQRLNQCGMDVELVDLARWCLQLLPEHRPADANIVAERIAAYRFGVELRQRKAESQQAAAIVRTVEGAKRRRQLSVAAVLLAVVLIVGVVGTTFGMVRAEIAADAERKARLAESAALIQANKRLSQIGKGNQTLAAIFSDLDIGLVHKSGQPLEQVLAERLIEAAQHIDEESVDDAATVALLRGQLGATIERLGFVKESIPLLEKAVEGLNIALGESHQDAIHARLDLANGYRSAGRINEAAAILEDAWPKLRESLGAEHSEAMICLNNLGLCRQAEQRFKEAIPYFEESLRLRRLHLGAEHLGCLSVMNNLAAAHVQSGDWNRGIELMERTLELNRGLRGPKHFNTMISMNNLGTSYRRAGRLAEALPMLENAVDLMKQNLGPTHAHTLATVNNLALTYKDSGRFQESKTLLEATHRVASERLGADHIHVRQTVSNLAAAYRESGDQVNAIRLSREAFEYAERRYGENHLHTLNCANDLAAAYWTAHRLDQSIPLFERTVQKFEKSLGRDRMETLNAKANLGVNYKDAGRQAEAIVLLEEAYKSRGQNPTLQWTGVELMEAYAKSNKAHRAVEIGVEVVADAKKKTPPNDEHLANELVTVANILIECRMFQAAEPLIRECHTLRMRSKPTGWSTFNAQSMLGGVLAETGASAEAEENLIKAYRGLQQSHATMPAAAKPHLQKARNRLVQYYTALGNTAEAEKWKSSPPPNLSAPSNRP